MARPRIPNGRAMGARDAKATTVTPARRGPPRYRYVSFLKIVSIENRGLSKWRDWLGCSSNVWKSADDTACVKCGTRQDMRSDKKQRAQCSCLTCVEGLRDDRVSIKKTTIDSRKNYWPARTNVSERFFPEECRRLPSLNRCFQQDWYQGQPL